MTDILCPSDSKIHGREPRYNQALLWQHILPEPGPFLCRGSTVVQKAKVH